MKSTLSIKIINIILAIFLQFYIINPAFSTTGENTLSSKHFKESKLNSYEGAIQRAKQFKSQAENVYELSMPLLADPQLYEAEKFGSLLAKTKEYKGDPKLNWMSSDQFRLWMQGRQLLIAMNAGQVESAKTIAAKLKQAITKDLYAPEGEYDDSSEFVCWSLGYLQAYYARHDDAAYDKNKDALKAAVAYQRAHYEELTGAYKEDFFSDVMWSYAMAIQAAAWRQDEDSYKEYMRGMAQLSGKDGSVALSIKKLVDDQFPAWLASIVYGSAVLRNDESREEIQKELISARKRSSKEQDKMLSFTTEHDYQGLAKNLEKQSEEVAEQSVSLS